MNTSALSPNCCVANATPPPETADPPGLQHEAYNMMVIGFFAFIILFGGVGNVVILATLCRWKNWKTSCNFFIANIAAADLGVVVIAAPLRIAELYLDWPSGLFLCKIIYPLQDVFMCVSIVTHSAIALERYRATVTPFKTRMSKKVTKFVILAVWIGCYVTAGIPQTIPGPPLEEQQGELRCSMEVLATPTNTRIFAIYQVLLFVVVQVVVQTVAYVMVIRTVLAKDDFLRMLSARKGASPWGQRPDSLDSRPSCTAILVRVKKTQRLVKMLLVLVVTFQLCHLPRGAMMLITVFSPGNQKTSAFYYVSLVVLALYYVKHVVNPVILYAMSKEFQDATKAICVQREQSTKTDALLTEKQQLDGLPQTNKTHLSREILPVRETNV